MDLKSGAETCGQINIMNDKTKKRRWFSKSGIFAIVCVLLLGGSVIIPALGPVVVLHTDVYRQNNLGVIAKAYLAYSITGKTPRIIAAKPGDTAHKAAYLLAKYTDLNDASLYFIKSDPHAPKNIPKVILLDLEGTDTQRSINPEFLKSELSFEIAANLSPNAPPTTTPVAWTRGLREDGTWSPDSPWGGGGGHIAYLDGHVEWADKLTLDGECFTIYATRPNAGKPTVNIREALPPGAVILSAEPKGQ